MTDTKNSSSQDRSTPRPLAVHWADQLFETLDKRITDGRRSLNYLMQALRQIRGELEQEDQIIHLVTLMDGVYGLNEVFFSLEFDRKEYSEYVHGPTAAAAADPVASPTVTGTA